MRLRFFLRRKPPRDPHGSRDWVSRLSRGQRLKLRANLEAMLESKTSLERSLSGNAPRR